MIDNQPELAQKLAGLIDAVGMKGLKEKINEKMYKMLAKLKKNNKQINESVINKDDLLQVFKEIDGSGLTD